MATELRNLELTEISLVDKGANPGAKVVIAKRAKEKNTMAKVSEIFKRFFGGEKITIEKELPDPAKQLDDLLSTLPEDKQALFHALIAALVAQGGGKPATPEAPKPEAPAQPHSPEGKDSMKPADIAKALTGSSPEAAQLFKSLSDSNAVLTGKVEALAKSLNAELGKNRKSEAVAKAASLKHIPGATVEKMAELIEKLHAESPELAAPVVEMLTKASAALAKRLPMAGHGRADGAGSDISGDAKAELEAIVQKRLGEVRKSGSKYTYEQAYADALESAPADLINRLSEERAAS